MRRDFWIGGAVLALLISLPAVLPAQETPETKPATEQPPEAAKPAEEKKEETKPAAEKPAGEEKKEETKPAEEKPAGEEKKEETKPAAEEKKPETPVSPEKLEWDALVKQREAIANELEKMKADFFTAKNKEKRTIHAAMQERIAKFEKDVQPGLLKLAPKIHEQNPDDKLAAEFTLAQAFQNYDFDKSVELARKLYDAEYRSPLVYNALGLSLYKTHQYAEAEKILQEGRELGRLGNESSLAITAIPELKALWEQERVIREKEAALTGDQQLPRVLFKTDKGDIELELFEDQAPNTVANFIDLVENKKYDGLHVHRVVDDFVIQAGDYSTREWTTLEEYTKKQEENPELGETGFSIKCECYEDDARLHFYGSLSMALAGKDTGDSQFFIVKGPATHLNPNKEQERGHTVFGRVIKGMDVVEKTAVGDKIISATVLRKRPHEYKPERTVKPKEEEKPKPEEEPATPPANQD